MNVETSKQNMRKLHLETYLKSSILWLGSKYDNVRKSIPIAYYKAKEKGHVLILVAAGKAFVISKSVMIIYD